MACCTKAVKRNRRGKGLLNKIINNLPVELHIPGYQYCGPDGTKLTKRGNGINFRGVFMRNKLPMIGPYIFESSIVNLDDKDGPGTH